MQGKRSYSSIYRILLPQFQDLSGSLKNFKKIMLQPGESKDVTMNVTTDDLKFYNSDLEI